MSVEHADQALGDPFATHAATPNLDPMCTDSSTCSVAKRLLPCLLPLPPRKMLALGTVRSVGSNPRAGNEPGAGDNGTSFHIKVGDNVAAKVVVILLLLLLLLLLPG